MCKKSFRHKKKKMIFQNSKKIFCSCIKTYCKKMFSKQNFDELSHRWINCLHVQICHDIHLRWDPLRWRDMIFFETDVSFVSQNCCSSWKVWRSFQILEEETNL